LTTISIVTNFWNHTDLFLLQKKGEIYKSQLSEWPSGFSHTA